MRNATRKRIEAAHAEIDRLIQMEKAWEHRTKPQANDLLQSIADGRNEWLRYPPELRQRYEGERSHD